MPLAGCSVTLKDMTTGATVDSGTTDSKGHWITSALAGTYYIDFDKSPRFLTRTGETVTLNGSLHEYYMASFVDSANYQCIGYCADPAKNTLYLSDSYFGVSSLAITSNGAGSWTGTTTVSYAGDGFLCLPISPLNVTYSWGIAATITAGIAAPLSLCPGNDTSGRSQTGLGVGFVISACVPYSITFHNANPTPIQYDLYVGNVSTITVTE